MLVKVSANCYYIPSCEIGDRPCLGYINGSKYAVMIDAGNSQNHVKAFYEELAAHHLKKPAFVVITHAHWDHTFGLCYLPIPSIGCQLTNLELQKMEKWEWSHALMEERVKTGEDTQFCVDQIITEYTHLEEIKVKHLDIVFEDKLFLDLGNLHIFLHKMVNSHSADGIGIYVLEDEVIYLGDSYCGKDISGEFIYSKNLLEQFIQDLETINFKEAIIGHDKHISKLNIIKELNDELAILNQETEDN